MALAVTLFHGVLRNYSTWKSAISDKEQVKKYDTEFCNFAVEDECI